MNFLPGILRRQGNSIHVRMDSGVELPLPGNAGGTEGQKVVYGVRPEHLSMGNENGVQAQVNVVEPTGADTFVFSQISGTPVCATFSERYAFKPGEIISLQPRLEAVHLFDSDSGKVIRAAG